MNLAPAIPSEDLLLARLVCAKLAGVLTGIVSVGVAALELHTPADFLAGKDRLVLGFLEVLRCIGGQPGHADEVELLRTRVDELAELAGLFHRRFLELAGWRGLPPESVRVAADRLSAAYTDLFRALGDFAALLGTDADYSGKVQQGRRRVEEFLRVVNGTP